MRKSIGIVVLAAVIIIAAILLVTSGGTPASQVPPTTGTASSTPSASSTAAFGQTVSDGTISFGVPSADFGLATDQSQITVTAYIPPCDPDFDYCLYYDGTAYKGTNFESAGFRIEKRTDLATESLCLNAPPAGFDASIKPSSTKSGDAYSSSVFSNVGDAGAGHYASGMLYRLYVDADSSCYEFETRIGQTQFANYPAGAIQLFTPADLAQVQSELDGILADISLSSSGEKGLFPVASSTAQTH